MGRRWCCGRTFNHPRIVGQHRLNFVIRDGVRLSVDVVERCVERDQGEDSFESPAVSLERFLSTVTNCILNDLVRHTSETDLRVVHQIPYRVLDVLPRHDLPAVRSTTHHILSHDPFHKVRVFWVIDILSPIRIHRGVVPSPGVHLGLLIQAPSAVSVAVENSIGLDLEPIHRAGAVVEGPEFREIRQDEGWVVDRLGSQLVAFPLPFDDRVGGEIARARAFFVGAFVGANFGCWHLKPNGARVNIVEFDLELAWDGISCRRIEPSEVNFRDVPPGVRIEHVKHVEMIVLPIEDDPADHRVLARNQVKFAIPAARERDELVRGSVCNLCLRDAGAPGHDRQHNQCDHQPFPSPLSHWLHSLSPFLILHS